MHAIAIPETPPSAEEFRALRKSLGWTQAQLSMRIERDVSTIRAYEAGRQPVPLVVWKALLRLRDEEVQSAARPLPLDWKQLPVVGTVNAGAPIIAEQHIEDYELVPAGLVRGEGFVLRVRGDSMEPEISAGDLVVVQIAEEPPIGRVVAITIDGETLLKRLVKRRGRLRLEAANPAYDPITLPAEGVIVHGYVVGLIRRFQ